MLVKKITYTDYNGMERTEDFYFSISRAELMELELGTSGGIRQKIERLQQTIDGPEIMKLFKELITLSICEKSPDGRRLFKSQEISNAFLQTEAYSTLLMELLSDPEKANGFMKAILPDASSLEENRDKPNITTMS